MVSATLLTSTVKSSLFTHVHSSHPPWLPVYINVIQTILVTLTMAGLFPDRPHMLILMHKELLTEKIIQNVKVLLLGKLSTL